MSPYPLRRESPHLPFSTWKVMLRDDCKQKNKLSAFDALGDFVLELMWRRGIDPNVQAIIGRGGQAQAPHVKL